MQTSHKLSLEIYCQSNSRHVAQLYTGLGMLEASGIIDAKWIFIRGLSANYQLNNPPLIKVHIKNGPRILFDQWDSYLMREDINWDEFDLLFKRCFNKAYIQKLPQRERVFPLGLNYYVLDRHDRGLRRILWAKNDVAKLKAFIQRAGWLSRLLQPYVQQSIVTCSVEKFEDLPHLTTPPRLLFLTRLWEPCPEEQGPEFAEQRAQLNQMRLDIIRELRTHYGEQFLGGLIPNSYAKETAPDCIVEQKITLKPHFVSAIKTASICITTTGLRDSIGWKFGEYVAAARAIVSEENPNFIPGPFEVGENYLTFSSAQQCMEAVECLVNDQSLMYAMMRNNLAYYNAYLRPDKLVLGALLTALQHTSQAKFPGK